MAYHEIMNSESFSRSLEDWLYVSQQQDLNEIVNHEDKVRIIVHWILQNLQQTHSVRKPKMIGFMRVKFGSNRMALLKPIVEVEHNPTSKLIEVVALDYEQNFYRVFEEKIN